MTAINHRCSNEWLRLAGAIGRERPESGLGMNRLEIRLKDTCHKVWFIGVIPGNSLK